MTNAAEVYVDTAVFIGLEYKEVIERYKERLKEKPDDHSTRLELGRMYVKCGLHDEAVRELNLAAQDPATRGRAKHESALAHYRAGRFQQAVEDGVAAMTADPDNERARAAMWLATRSMGGYPESVPESFRMELKAGYEPARVQFENIAAKIGLDKISAGRGTAVFDYNNDGLLDIVVTAAHAGCSLYRNNGDGTFTDVTVQSGLDKCINGFVIIAGDYDNDGFQDLFVTRQGFYYGDCGLYHNNGDGTFTERHREGRRAELGARLYRVLGRLRLRRPPRPVHRLQSGRHLRPGLFRIACSITTETARLPTSPKKRDCRASSRPSVPAGATTTTTAIRICSSSGLGRPHCSATTATARSRT